MVALVLLTLAVVLGIADVSRLQSERWPRFIVDGVHRRVSMLSVAFVVVHIATTVLDGYVPVGWLDAVIPFRSPYRTVWLGLGAVAFDLLLAVIITSLLRARVGYRSWRAVHWLAYACW
ncbi:MAG TPA: ferric reductase-like transmembrane domain-containing protein, partial [Solirubrobacteraceae bacterium]|nr:ferric reductase-like transmembrane domain-containing protein [Solirubrobacteraceae bacterium]